MKRVKELSRSTKQLDSESPPEKALIAVLYEKDNYDDSKTKEVDQEDLQKAKDWTNRYTSLQQNKKLALHDWFRLSFGRRKLKFTPKAQKYVRRLLIDSLSIKKYASNHSFIIVDPKVNQLSRIVTLTNYLYQMQRRLKEMTRKCVWVCPTDVAFERVFSRNLEVSLCQNLVAICGYALQSPLRSLQNNWNTL